MIRFVCLGLALVVLALVVMALAGPPPPLANASWSWIIAGSVLYWLLLRYSEPPPPPLSLDGQGDSLGRLLLPVTVGPWLVAAAVWWFSSNVIELDFDWRAGAKLGLALYLLGLLAMRLRPRF